MVKGFHSRFKNRDYGPVVRLCQLSPIVGDLSHERVLDFATGPEYSIAPCWRVLTIVVSLADQVFVSRWEVDRTLREGLQQLDLLAVKIKIVLFQKLLVEF